MALGERGENHAQIHFPLGLSSAGARNWSYLNHMAKNSGRIFKHGLRTKEFRHLLINLPWPTSSSRNEYSEGRW